MAISRTITAIDRRAGRVYVRIGGVEVEIAATNVTELREWVRLKFDESEEYLLAIALALLLARDPDLTNPGQIVGRTITLNLNGALNQTGAVIRVT